MQINHLSEPLAITMWDSSWLRRRYPGGGFESFDKALDELVDRGYNAVRIDCFPHMIANAPDGTNSERFLDPAGFGLQWYGFAQWGSPWTVYIYPRRDLVEFLKKCEKRNVWVLLSTWLKPTIEPRNEWLNGWEDLVRIWHETLCFLQENDCLKPVIGVDLSNEIPFGNCNKQLSEQLNRLGAPGVLLTPAQKAFYRDYYTRAILALREHWPDMPFSVSQSESFFEADREYDFTDHDFLDAHIFSDATGFLKDTGYHHAIAAFGDNVMVKDPNQHPYWGNRFLPPDIDFERVNDRIHESWYKNRTYCIECMEHEISFVADLGKKYGIPVGCTEGWGSIMWAQHPMLSWDMIKDAGMIAAGLGRKYGYSFNCQSNFCEPQFVSLWNDVDYHREITSIICGTKVL